LLSAPRDSLLEPAVRSNAQPRSQPRSLRLCDSFRFFLFCTSSIAAGAAVFLQLVVQGLQTDTQNFSRAGLIVVSGLESLNNQQPLGFADRRSNPNTNGIRIIRRRPHQGVSESRRQMLCLSDCAFTNNYCAL